MPLPAAPTRKASRVNDRASAPISEAPRRAEPLKSEAPALRPTPSLPVARTDRPVRIERNGSVLTGVGMEFNNAARSLTVDSRVRGTWTFAPNTE